MLKDNQAEVELGKLAEQRSQNQQVKQFAQEIVQDHQRLVEQLEKIAGARGRNGSASSPARESATSTANERNENTTTETADNTRTTSANETSTQQAGMRGGALHELASIDRQIDERCNQMLREALQQKSGHEFDQCYVGSQVIAHMHMLAALDVISQDTNGQLKQIAEDAKPTVQKHLEKAKDLAKELMNGRNTAEESRTSTSTERQALVASGRITERHRS